MLTRRTLLVGALAPWGAGLGGCAPTPPGAGVTPLVSPTLEMTTAHRAVLGLHALVAALEEPSPASAWCAGVLDEQVAALGLDTPAPAATASDVDAVRRALAAATVVLRTHALDARTADPLAWASIAAWTRGARAALAAEAPLLEASRTRLSPAPTDPAGALTGLILAADEVRFALEVAAGAPALSAGRADAARDRLAAWTALRREAARALAALPSATVPAAVPAFAADRPGTADEARTLVARVETAGLPAVGRAVASGPDAVRPALVDALVAGAGVLPAWAATLPRWPGYPS